MKVNDFVEVSLKDGAKFVFQVDSNMIVYECSPLSGKEYVSVNGKTVSESQNFKLKSTHSFSVNETEYQITFECKDLFKGHSECSLQKNGGLFKTYKLTYVQPQKKPFYYWLPPLILGGLAGVGIARGIIPIWLCVFLGILAFVFVFIIEFRSNMENWSCEVEGV